MPLLNITTSETVKDRNRLLEKSAQFVSELTKKPTKFVMVQLKDSQKMFFADSQSPCCYLEVKSIGSITPKEMAKRISEFFAKEISIPPNRIYINFHDIPASMWAWNGETFG